MLHAENTLSVVANHAILKLLQRRRLSCTNRSSDVQLLLEINECVEKRHLCVVRRPSYRSESQRTTSTAV